ncbi:MAG: TetR/AcrR family transcriptional regulator [Candidatus Krumholzibacteria bacterium]
MGIPERREREKERRRVDIIDAAEKVFFSKGIGQATMHDVAEAAELSKGTLYLYFKNKEDLYLAIILRGMAILQAGFEAAVKSTEKGIDKVAAIGRAYFDFCDNHPDYVNAMLHYESRDAAADPSGYASECNAQGKDITATCARAVQSGIEDGSIRGDVDPVRTALTLWGLSTGVVQIIATKGEMIKELHGIDPQDLTETFFDLINRALNPDGPAGRGGTR